MKKLFDYFFNYEHFYRIVIITLLLMFVIFGCTKTNVEPDGTPPTVVTSAITDITINSAVSGGLISNKGTSDVINKGVCWSTSQSPTIKSNYTVDTGTPTFISNLTNLAENTTYYVRAYATNSYGTGYGENVSFTTLKFKCGEPIIYDGKTYNTVKIGDQCWFQENLNVGTRINGSQKQTNNNVIEKHCYNDEDINCEFYGALYQWDEMMKFSTSTQGICPTGWHIPSKGDWLILTDYLGGNSIAGGKIKEIGLNNWATPNYGATNSSGFTALGTGKHSSIGFDGIMLFAYMWSSTTDISDPKYSWSATPYSAGEELYIGLGLKENSFSVRCVKN
jgi:uncharacterized protein (TIGR02145 family)